VIARAVGAATAAVLGASLLAGIGVGPASAAGSSATITTPQAERAPRHGQGGIMSPYVACAKPKQKPHVLWTLNNAATGWQNTYSWVGAYPGMKFPRVDPGTYVSTTIATCKRHQTVQTVSVAVTRKTRRTTISHREFARISHGMKRRTVNRIVGYAGRARAATPHGHVVTYDMDAFWAWATVRYRHGHVVGKQWDVGHD
jgi:hypothetical protein